jgi:hypothetical protein
VDFVAVEADDAQVARTPVQLLAGALLADAEGIARRAATAMQETIPSYANVPLEDLTPIVLANTRNLCGMIADPDMDPMRAQADYRESGEVRARQGITSDEMLMGWRIGLEVTRKEAHAIATELDIGTEVLLEFIEATLQWGDVGMLASMSAHREAEFELARTEQHHRANLVRGVLFGTLSPAEIRVQASGYGLDLESSYQAVRTRPGDLTVRELERKLGVADGAGPRHGLAALVDGDLVGFVLAPIPGAITATVGVGPPAALHDLANSFRLATRAFEAAIAVAAPGPVGMESLGLVPAVIADRDVGDELLRRIVDPVLAHGRTGEALVETVVRYLHNDLRLEFTADELFLHVNTVRYRLRRFEELSGMNLRRVDDLVQVWWAIRRRGLAGTSERPL